MTNTTLTCIPDTCLVFFPHTCAAELPYFILLLLTAWQEKVFMITVKHVPLQRPPPLPVTHTAAFRPSFLPSHFPSVIHSTFPHVHRRRLNGNIYAGGVSEAVVVPVHGTAGGVCGASPWSGLFRSQAVHLLSEGCWVVRQCDCLILGGSVLHALSRGVRPQGERTEAGTVGARNWYPLLCASLLNVAHSCLG